MASPRSHLLQAACLVGLLLLATIPFALPALVLRHPQYSEPRLAAGELCGGQGEQFGSDHDHHAG